MQTRTPINLLLIALSYIILIILLNPIGDFPINDDWAYARSVLSLVDNGEFHLLGWGATCQLMTWKNTFQLND